MILSFLSVIFSLSSEGFHITTDTTLFTAVGWLSILVKGSSYQWYCKFPCQIGGILIGFSGRVLQHLEQTYLFEAGILLMLVLDEACDCAYRMKSFCVRKM